MSLARCFLMAALCTFLAGCYASYTGTYSVRQATQKPLAAFADIGDRLYVTIRPLGFRKMEPPEPESDFVWFLKTAGDRPQGDATIEGEDARITVAVGLRDLIITVRDWTYSDETDFMRILKSTIEQQLKEQYDVVGIKFERQREFPLLN